MKLRVDRFQIGDEAQVTLGRGQGKVRISQQKESAGSLGRTARGGNVTFSWTDPFMLGGLHLQGFLKTNFREPGASKLDGGSGLPGAFPVSVSVPSSIRYIA